MKKYLVFLLMLVSFAGYGQFVNYTNINGRYKWIAGKFDSTFTLPSGTTPSLRVGGGTGPGALFYNTSDSVVYQYTGSQWRPLHGSDTGRIQIAYVRNTTASPMTTGQVVYINGSTGNVPTVALAINTADSASAMTFGFVRGAIPVNGFGWITTFGPIDGINTNAYDEGEVIYLDSLAGQFTHFKPQAPKHLVTLGYIVKKAANGIIFVKIQNGYELEELHNVRITGPVLNKSVIIYDSVRSLWVDTTVSAAGLGLGGSGTTNYLSKWTSSTALGNSLVFDNGTNVGIGTNNPTISLGTGLSVYGSSYSTVRVFAGAFGNGLDMIFGGAAESYIYNRQNGFLEFGTNNTARMRVTAAGRVLIGTSTESTYALDLVGTFRSTGDANINGLTVGKGGGSVATNTAVGINALNAVTTGATNTAVGWYALRAVTTGGGNVAIGRQAMLDATGDNNVAVGINAMFNAGGGSNNVAVGRDALRTSSASSGVTALGAYAAYSTSGNFNTAVGQEALYSNTSGTNQVAIGFRSLTSATGASNVALGYYSGYDITTGTFNTIIGTGSVGNGITTGSYNTIIGSQITGLSSSLSNTIILADGQGNQRLYINNSGNVGIGTTSPTNTLQIQNANSTYSNPASTNVPSIYVNNTSNASTTAHSIMLLRTGGASGGNPFVVFDNNVVGYSMGLDNADSDKFKVTSSWLGVGSGTVLLSLASGGSTIGTSLSVAGDLGGGGKLLPTFANTGEYIFNSASNGYAISIFTGSSESMRVFNSTGNVLIQRGGTFTDAGYKLDVNGTARVQGNMAVAQATLPGTLSAGIGYLFLGGSACIWNPASSTQVLIGMNQYYDGTNSVRKVSGYSSSMYMDTNGDINFSAAGTAAAGSIVSSTSTLQIKSNGNTIIGGNLVSKYGVLPSALSTNLGYYFNGGTGVFWSANNNNDVVFSMNNYFDGTNTVRIKTGYSSQLYFSDNGDINLRTATTGAAGSSVTFDNGLFIKNGGSVGIGTSSPNASALLDVSSTTKGFLPPRMTNAQMVAIATPAAGLVVYDTTNNKLNVYDGTNWVAVH